MRHFRPAFIGIAALAALALGAVAPGHGPAPALAVPTNDNFVDAMTITAPGTPDIAASGDSSGATTEAGERVSFPLNGCSTTGFPFSWNSTVWYNWTSPATAGSLRLDTWGSDYGTSIVVYTGNAVNALTPVAGACNYGGNATGGNPAWVTLDYAPSTTYRIQVGRQAGSAGNLVLNMESGALLIVNSTADNNTSDGFLSLREALLLSAGGTTPGGLNRALDGSEQFQVIGTPNDTTADAVRFLPGSFAPGTPTTILLGSGLPMPGSNNTISGIGAGVIIDGNGSYPIYCLTMNFQNHVEGVQVRRCTSGIIASDNTRIGGDHPLQRNVIKENIYGVAIGVVCQIEVLNNLIGTDSTGSIAAGNATGIYVGTSCPLAYTISGNTISGNSSDGISGNNASSGLIRNNKIGTKADSTGDLGNGAYGINLIGSSGVEVRDNIVSGNTADGIHLLDSPGVQIKGNRIGMVAFNQIARNDLSGISVFGNSPGTVIGAPGEGNIISANGHRGLYLVGAASGTVQSNRIGVDNGGTVGVANALEGIFLDGGAFTIGGTGPGEGNIISGNGGNGITSYSDNHVIKGNLIGIGTTGGAIPNGGDGIRLGGAQASESSKNVLVGAGTGEGGANTIAHNTAHGVEVVGLSSYFNQIRINSIYSNGGLGIAFTNGGNGEPPPPVIQNYVGGTLFGSGCGGCTIDVYEDFGGEGEIYIGTTTAGPNTAWALAAAAHGFGDFTAVATRPLPGYYESTVFSTPFTAPPNHDGDGMFDSTDPCPFSAEDYDAYSDGDGCPDSDNDVDGICDPGQESVSCTGSDTGKICFDPAGTLSCGTLDCRNVAEDLDAFKDSDGCPEPDNDNDAFPDAADACPGADAHTGPDGMLGSPQDMNHNGVSDGGEGTLTSDDLLSVKWVFEDYDGVLDTDGCHDSPGEDFDGDGYADDVEALNIGTNAGYPCGINGWPSNLFDNPNGAVPTVNELTIQDILSFVAPVRHFGTSPPNSLYDKRWDLLPGPGTLGDYINIQDLIATIAQTPTGYPPMLNGVRAFGQSCPLPP